MDKEPNGPKYIFGDTSPSLFDIKPQIERKKFVRVKKDFDFRAQSQRVRKSLKNNVVNIGKAAITSAEESDSTSYTYTEIPDSDSSGNYGSVIRPTVANALPERDAEKRLDVENIIDYDSLDLLKVSDLTETYTENIKELLLNEGASLLLSYDDATSQTEAILRDGLGVNVEIDSSISEAISQIMKLNIICFCLRQVSLPPSVRKIFIETLSTKVAEDTHAAMSKAHTSEKYSSILKNLQARMRENTDSDVSSELGVLRKRSRKNFSAGKTSQEKHLFNTTQNENVRTQKF